MSAPIQTSDESQVILHQLKGSFTSIYLTVLSIVQGVTLATLATVVADNYPRFTAVQWALVVLTFCILVIIWHHMTTDAMTWVWIPDVRDSLIPFLLGAFELYQTQAIVLGLGPWLFGMVAGAVLAVLEFFHVGCRVPLEEENGFLLEHFRTRRRPDMLQGIVGIGLFVGLGAVSVFIVDAKGAVLPDETVVRAAFPWIAVLLTSLWLGCYLIRTTLYWRVIAALARGGRLPASTPLSRLVGLPRG